MAPVVAHICGGDVSARVNNDACGPSPRSGENSNSLLQYFKNEFVYDEDGESVKRKIV